MDHKESVKLHAVQRYLADELEGDVRDSFEQHYFECSICSGQVYAGLALLSNVRVAIADDPIVSAAPPSFWTKLGRGSRAYWNSLEAAFAPRVMASALLLLICVFGYENLVVIPSLQSRVSTPFVAPESYIVLHPTTRGELTTVPVASGQEMIGLRFDLPASASTGTLMARLSGPGASGTNFPIAAAASLAPVQLILPRKGLVAGATYTLSVDRDSVTIFHFNFHLTE